MSYNEEQQAQQAASNHFLATISAVAECLGEASPAVGGPIRHKLTRLRSRLAFDPSPNSLDEGRAQFENDLKRYAVQAGDYLKAQRRELHKASHVLGEHVAGLRARQEFYAGQLRQIASRLQEKCGADVTQLLRVVESLSSDGQSRLGLMGDELRAIETRTAEYVISDPVTGLMNRREAERQIEARHNAGEIVTLVVFRLAGDLADDILQQAAIRLWSQFRPSDMVVRWSDDELGVLFNGPLQIAEMRTSQVVPWIAGRYPMDNGEAGEVRVEARVLTLDSVPA
jgi:hypothetical protein